MEQQINTLEKRTEEAWTMARNQQEKLSIIKIDLDNIKRMLYRLENKRLYPSDYMLEIIKMLTVALVAATGVKFL